MATCACWRQSGVGTIASNTSQASRTAASSRSELVMGPVGFDLDDSDATISGGNATRHTVGWKVPLFLSRLNQTPPAPKPDASTYARKDGFPGTNSSTEVGRELMQCSRTFQSLRDWCSSGVIVTCCWCCASAVVRALYIGENSPFPLGMPIAAWLSFPMTLWKVWRGIVFCCRTLLMS